VSCYVNRRESVSDTLPGKNRLFADSVEELKIMEENLLLRQDWRSSYYGVQIQVIGESKYKRAVKLGAKELNGGETNDKINELRGKP